MLQFKIKQDRFNEIKKDLFIKMIPMVIISSLGALAITYYNTNGQQGDLSFIFLFIPIMIGAFAFSFYRTLNMQKEIFNTYKLFINDDFIRREQHNTQPISIPKASVSEIIKNSNGSFTIIGDSKINAIGVPSQIDDYENLEKTLSEIMQISVRTSIPFVQKYQALISVLTLGCMVAVYLSTNKIIVGISGVVLITVLVYSFVVIQKSKNIDNRTKKLVWVMIPLMISLISSVYYKLVG